MKLPFTLGHLFKSLGSRGERKRSFPLLARALGRAKAQRPPDAPFNVLERLQTLFHQARPLIRLVPKKIAGVSCRIPAPYRSKTSATAQAYGWFKESLRARPAPLAPALEAELVELLDGRSKVFKARLEHHRQVVANKHLIRFLRRKRRR